ncbi:MAG: hypothetical protein ABJ239_04235 [Erythrobacter sp.]
MTAYRIFTSGRREDRFGHGTYLDIASSTRTVDNQAQVLSAVRQERARRAMMAG